MTRLRLGVSMKISYWLHLLALLALTVYAQNVMAQASLPDDLGPGGKKNAAMGPIATEPEFHLIADEEGVTEAESLNVGSLDNSGSCQAGCDNCSVRGSRGCTGRVWMNAEYLFWYARGMKLPALVTSSPTGTDRNLGSVDSPVSGVLGVPTTSVLYGDERVAGGVGSGGRYEIGVWLDSCMDIGIGGRYFHLAGDSEDFIASSETSGNSILARPYFNVGIDGQDAFLVAFDDLFSGNANVKASQDVLSVEAFTKILLMKGNGFRYDLIGGYHHGQINSDLSVTSSLVTVDVDPFNPGTPVGTSLDVLDSFEVENDFHGGGIGIAAQWQRGKNIIKVLGKASFGNMHQSVAIRGQTSSMTPAPSSTSASIPFGLLAQDSNSGRFEQDRFAVVPEANITLVRRLTCNLDFTIGYSFIYWSSVQQAGDLIDASLDLDGIPPQTQPTFAFRDTDFWAQGLNLGLNLRF